MRETASIKIKESGVDWIPDFGQPIVILRALLVTVAIAILLTLLRTGLPGLDIETLGPIVFLSVWICCLSAVGLQTLRKYGSQLPVGVVATIALFWVVASAGICGVAPYVLGIPAAFASDQNALSMALEAMLITLIVGAVVLRFLYAHHELQNQQKRLLDAKYDALEARIRPHFLFNSLNSVAELIAIDSARAENALLDLSDLFRATLTDHGPVQIRQELALCEKYLCVEKLRMGDRLSWRFDVDKEAEAFLIPALSLQPLFENAVLHGVQPLPEGGEIEMSLKVVESRLMLKIKNPVGSQAATTSRGTGTALKNIQARLAAFYSTPVTFTAEKAGNDYVVELGIPHVSAIGVLQ